MTARFLAHFALLSLALAAHGQEGRRPLQVEPNGWSARAAREVRVAEYSFQPAGSGVWSAPNRAQGLRARVSRERLEVFARSAGTEGEGVDWELDFAFRGLERDGQQLPASAVSLEIEGGTARRDHGIALERLSNEERGIRHALELRRTPGGAEALRVGLDIRGLGLRIRDDGRSGALCDATGAERLHCRDLRATDAAGRELAARLVATPRGAAIELDDRGARLPLSVELLLSGPWSADGGQTGAAFGFALASAGDVNGDGFSDVIVGAYDFDDGEDGEGAVFVYHGSSSGLPELADWSAQGSQAQAYFGYSVATAGDVNGDGYSDVIVGARAFDGDLVDEGAAFVYLGSAAGLAATPAWTVQGDLPSVNLGYSVSTAGDVNGDGFSDVVVGVPLYSNGHVNEGRAYVHLGSASGLSTSPAAVREGDSTAARFGTSVSTAGDVNVDGFDDILVGAPYYTNGQGSEGRAFLFFGDASAAFTSTPWSAEGNNAGANFGASVAPAGDVNADGRADWIVGAPGFSNGESSEGKAYVYFGNEEGIGGSWPAAWMLESNQASARFGHAVSSAGDFDGDGYGDIAVGACFFDAGHGDGGRVSVFFGGETGPATSAAWSRDGDQEGCWLGWAVALAGDVDADGFSDLLVGAPHHGSGVADDGRATSYPGAPRLGLGRPSPGALRGTAPNAWFGTSVAAVGDVRGEGIGTVLVGEPNYSNGQSNEGRVAALGQSWTAEGNQAQLQLGSAVAGAGDVNDDGYADVLLGEPRHDGLAGTDCGRARLHLGSPNGISATPSWVLEGTMPGESFGHTVASAGDVDGDGFGDVLVGCPNDARVYVNGGRAYLYRGSSSGLATSPSWVGIGDQGFGFYGCSLASAGDVNGDGFSDVLVGAKQRSEAEYEEGRGYLYLGSSGGLSTNPAWFVDGGVVHGNLGGCVSGAGDVNADGFSDVILGAPSDSSEGFSVCRVLVFHGSPAGLASSADWTVVSDGGDEWFGHSVASAGDVNGDGYGDVIVGAPEHTRTHFREGRACLYLGSASGLAAAPQWTGYGSQASAKFGFSVSGAGDLDGNGVADAVVGAPGYSLDFGPANGRVFVYLGKDGAPGRVRLIRQRHADDSAPIGVLGSTKASQEFSVATEFREYFGALGWASGVATRARLETQVGGLHQPFDAVPVDQGLEAPYVLDPLPLSHVVDTVPSGLSQAGDVFRWRARVRTNNPLFPVTPWFTVAGKGTSEAKLRTHSAVLPRTKRAH